MADGKLKSLGFDIDPSIHTALSTRRGREKIGLDY